MAISFAKMKVLTWMCHRNCYSNKKGYKFWKLFFDDLLMNNSGDRCRSKATGIIHFHLRNMWPAGYRLPAHHRQIIKFDKWFLYEDKWLINIIPFHVSSTEINSIGSMKNIPGPRCQVNPSPLSLSDPYIKQAHPRQYLGAWTLPIPVHRFIECGLIWTITPGLSGAFHSKPIENDSADCLTFVIRYSRLLLHMDTLYLLKGIPVLALNCVIRCANLSIWSK